MAVLEMAWEKVLEEHGEASIDGEEEMWELCSGMAGVLGCEPDYAAESALEAAHGVMELAEGALRGEARRGGGARGQGLQGGGPEGAPREGVRGHP